MSAIESCSFNIKFFQSPSPEDIKQKHTTECGGLFSVGVAVVVEGCVEIGAEAHSIAFPVFSVSETVTLWSIVVLLNSTLSFESMTALNQTKMINEF